MVKKTKCKLDVLQDELWDVDVTPSGGWIGVTALDQNQRLLFKGSAVSLPQPIQFPHVAAVNEDLVFIVNGRTRDEKNGWVITSTGEVLSHFYAGDAVLDVLASERFLIVTYFDESACTSDGIEGNGVAVFDLNGNYVFGYQETFGSQAVTVYDCYCACWAGNGQIYFHPYDAFPVVLWDLEKGTQEIFDSPVEIVGSKAMTTTGPEIYFHSPYRDQTGIYEWRLGDEKAKKIGEQAGRIRGVRGGKFILIEEDGFSIIDPTEIVVE